MTIRDISMPGRRPKTTKFTLWVMAYRYQHSLSPALGEGKLIRISVKAENTQGAMKEALSALQNKGYTTIRLERAKIGRRVVFENKEKG